MTKDKKHEVTFIEIGDGENWRIELDGKQIADLSYDAYGWSGVEAILETTRKLAKKLGAKVTDTYLDEVDE